MVNFSDILSATETALDSFTSELTSSSGFNTGGASAALTDAPVADASIGEATSDGTTATTAPLTAPESSGGAAYTTSPSTAATIYEDASGDDDSNWSSSESTDSLPSSAASEASAARAPDCSSSSATSYTNNNGITYGGGNNNSISTTPEPASNVAESPYDSDQGISTTSANSGSMSGASIVGVIVGTVGVLMVAVVFAFWRRRRQARYSQSTSGDSLRFESVSGSRAFKNIKSGRNHQELAINMDSRGLDSLSARAPQPGDDGPWADPALAAVRIPLEMIDKQEMISRGGFGLVYSATYKGETVAVKTLLPENRKNMTEIEAFFVEIRLMAELEHPRIVRFIGVAWNALSDVECVSEFMVGGDLHSILTYFEGEGGDPSQKRSHGFDMEKVQIALHVTHGLSYLHSLDPVVLHRDLKSRNVLLSSTMEAKLTDFGVSRHRSDGLMTCNVGTSLWMAPEVMMGQRYDEKADLFSFGVLLSELDSHVTPYANAVNPSNGRRLVETAILQMVASGELQVEFSPECSPGMRELGLACTSLDPRHRPSATEALYKLQLALRALKQEEVSL